MYKALTINLLLFSAVAFAQPQINWNAEFSVADGSQYGNLRPRMALNGDGNPVVVFGKPSTNDVFVARWNGTAFDTPIEVTPPNVGSYYYNWTGADIGSKGDTMYVVFKALPMESGNIFTVRSFDGGVTWSDTVRVDSYPNNPNWIPSIEVDDAGHPTVVFMSHATSWVDPTYLIAQSNDYGASYQTEITAAQNVPGEACDCCPAEMVFEGNKRALLFRNNNSNVRDMWAVYSENGGQTYPFYADVDSTEWTLTSCPSSAPHGVFVGDTLYTVWHGKPFGQSQIFISSTYANGGLNYTNRYNIMLPANGNTVMNYPRIVEENDTMIVVWQENLVSNTDIYCAISTTGVTGLLNHKYMVNDSTPNQQMNPDVAFRNGQVHVIYQDYITGDVVYRKGNVVSGVNVEELNNDLNVSVYPNPSLNGEFQIASETNFKAYEVVNIKGQKVSATWNNGTLKIADAKKGTYFLTLITKDERKVSVSLFVQ